MKTETGMMKTRGGILVIIITLIFFFFVLKEVHLLVPTLTSQFCVILCYLLHLTAKILPSSLLYISFISSLFKFRLPGFTGNLFMPFLGPICYEPLVPLFLGALLDGFWLILELLFLFGVPILV